jgi:hypothetical protein
LEVSKIDMSLGIIPEPSEVDLNKVLTVIEG